MGGNFGKTAGGYESETRGGAVKVGTDDDEDKIRINGRVCTKTQELSGQQQESEFW